MPTHKADAVKPSLQFNPFSGEKLEGSLGVRTPDTSGDALGAARTRVVEPQDGCRLVFHSDPNSPAADRFRYLRIRLRELWNTGKLKTLLITSALPQDGKSTVALNLASALSEQGRKKVLLIEADLHRPTLSPMLGLEPGPGVLECLETGLSPLPLVTRLDPLGWYLLPAGGSGADPTELLQSNGFSELLEKVAPHFDWILIDSPPLIPVTDAIALARDVDGTLMVVRAGSTPRSAVERALALLGRKKLVAVTLNGMEPLDSTYGNYGYYGRYRSKTEGNQAAQTLRPVAGSHSGTPK